MCAGVRAAVGSSLGFVAYRQARNGGNPTDFVQVSPLVDRMFCRVNPSDEIQSTLDDPFVRYLDITGTPHPDFQEEVFVFVDRYPHLYGKEYRYQLVYFDAQGEIVAWRTTDWVLAQ